MNDSAGDTQKLRLGGMALENGLLVYGPNYWTAAVRAKDGQIIVKDGKVPRFGKTVDGIPGLRGVARLGEAMAVIPLVRAKLPQARLPFEHPAVIATGAATAAVSMVMKRRKKRSVGGDLALSLLGMAPAIISLRSGNVAAYHGVEHKSIAAYEQGSDSAADAAKEHERCGSHLVAPMVLASVAGEAIMRRALERPGAIAQTSVALAGAAASIEMFGWAERHSDSQLAKIFRAPGFELQRAVGTREPTAEQLEVGRAAMERLLAVEAAA
ncbi:MAG TPA: DUF1385 domain-containing protein, partial [Solirubrobacterales bacterium]|nr:DUF1385 domain-containing protein [Solirubrobacterales bacterium]